MLLLDKIISTSHCPH